MDAQSVAGATTAAGKIAMTLAPAFIAGFAVQQALEVIDSVISAISKWDENVKVKKAVLSVLSVLIAIFIVSFSNLNVLAPFTKTNPNVVKADVAKDPNSGKDTSVATDPSTGTDSNPCAPRPFIAIFLSIVFISAGTEGFNSLLKWLSYKKEDAKASAAKNKGTDDTKTGMKVLPS